MRVFPREAIVAVSLLFCILNPCKGFAADDLKIEVLRYFAELGYPDAQLEIGKLYAEGIDLAKDNKQAVAWFHEAAKLGDAEGQGMLGECYLQGKGVAIDYVKAVSWLRKSALQGNANSQYLLGLCYGQGKGVGIDDQQGFAWTSKAAEKGHGMAQYNLGQCHLRGKGVGADSILAYKWFNLAAAAGVKNGARYRNELESRMTREEVAEAQRLTQEWQPQDSAVIEGQAIPSLGSPKGNGTGFFVTGQGHLLTAAHVVRDAKRITVAWNSKVYEASKIQFDPSNDLAVLRCELDVPTPALPITSTGQLGQTVFTIGFPNIDFQGLAPKVTKGEISSLSGLQDDPCLYQITVPIQPGNSGGPLIDESGNVVGLINSRVSDKYAFFTSGMLPQNVNYAVKCSYIIPLLDIPECRESLPEKKKEIVPFQEAVKEAIPAICLVLVY